MVRRAEASQERRRAILDAALEVFLDKGLFDATIGDIRARSGASTGSLYHHFEGKEAIAAALYLEGVRAIHARLDAVRDQEPTTRGVIEGVVRAYLGWYAEHPRWGLFQFRAEDAGFRAEDREAMRREEEAFLERWERWLVPRVEAGEVYRMPPMLYVAVLQGPARDFLRRWLPYPDPDALETHREHLARAAWRALGRGAAGASGRP
jgi:AcrR family transcriptional regulator